MVNNSLPFDFDGSSECFLAEAESVTDPVLLQHCLFYSQSQSSSSWGLVQAYLLWRLNQLDELYIFLNTFSFDSYFDAQYWVLTGIAYKFKNQIGASLHAYKYAILLSPDRFDIYYNSANIFSSIDFFIAFRYYAKSLELNPYSGSSWHNLASLLLSKDLLASSLSASKTSLYLCPDNPHSLCTLGLIYMDLRSYCSSEKCFLKSIAFDPNYIDSYINLGYLLLSLRRIDDAISYLQKALSINPCSSSALFNLGLCHLLLGRFSSGWKFYEQRLTFSSYSTYIPPTAGSKLSSIVYFPHSHEQPLAVFAEQGFGDTIQFSRYLSLLHSMSVPIVFYCQDELVSFFREWFIPKVNILPRSMPSMNSSSFCSLLSLPYLFNTDELTIPSFALFQAPECSTPSHLSVEKSPGGLSVGLVWASDPCNVRMYRNKSISLSMIMPFLMTLVDLDLIDLHSLQVSSDSNAFKSWTDHPRVFDWSDKISNFSDTAYLVSQLDLVISVDTAVAHLSASLECPTWVMLSYDSDFRWLHQRTDSPWYPNTVRLFRQTTPHNWASVLKSLKVTFERLFLVDLDSLSEFKLKA